MLFEQHLFISQQQQQQQHELCVGFFVKKTRLLTTPFMPFAHAHDRFFSGVGKRLEEEGGEGHGIRGLLGQWEEADKGCG